MSSLEVALNVGHIVPYKDVSKRAVPLSLPNYVKYHLAGSGAVVEDYRGVTLIVLPEKARVEKGASAWQHTISFYVDGNPEDQYVEVDLSVDANETALRLMTE